MILASFVRGGNYDSLVGGALLLATALTEGGGVALPAPLALRPAAAQLTTSVLSAHGDVLPVIAGLLHAGAAPLLQAAAPTEAEWLERAGVNQPAPRADWQTRLLGSMAQCCALVRTLAAAAVSSAEEEDSPEMLSEQQQTADIDLFCERRGYGIVGALLEAQLSALVHSDQTLVAAAVGALATILPRASGVAVAGEIALGLANVLFPALEREGLLPLPLLWDSDESALCVCARVYVTLLPVKLLHSILP